MTRAQMRRLAVGTRVRYVARDGRTSWDGTVEVAVPPGAAPGDGTSHTCVIRWDDGEISAIRLDLGLERRHKYIEVIAEVVA